MWGKKQIKIKKGGLGENLDLDDYSKLSIKGTG